MGQIKMFQKCQIFWNLSSSKIIASCSQSANLSIDVKLNGVSCFYNLFLFLSAPMLQLNSVPLSFLLDNGLPKEDGFPGRYLAGVLHALIQLAGQDKTVEIWRGGKVSIESFVQKDQLNEFVASNVSRTTLIKIC